MAGLFVYTVTVIISRSCPGASPIEVSFALTGGCPLPVIASLAHSISHPPPSFSPALMDPRASLICITRRATPSCHNTQPTTLHRALQLHAEVVLTSTIVVRRKSSACTPPMRQVLEILSLVGETFPIAFTRLARARANVAARRQKRC